MSFGLYIHIPFCLQQCTYCDFTTIPNDYSQHSAYVEDLLQEIKQRAAFIPKEEVKSIYFGGGTPSLISPNELSKIILEFSHQGFDLNSLEEITLEVNPGTLNQSLIEQYQSIGVNRFSVGVQTFSDQLLKKIGRLHSSEDSIQTLDLLNKNQLNYSFDLLFALPNQSIQELKTDLKLINLFSPPHISSYYLTIPKKHKLNKGRPLEEEELKMFDLVEEELEKGGYHQYEISNYSKPGFKSQHNSSAWYGGFYWGIGISAHSHLNISGDYYRFWNPNSMKLGKQNLLNYENPLNFPQNYIEKLSPIDRANDIVHTSLRLSEGFKLSSLSFLETIKISALEKQLNLLITSEFVSKIEDHYILTKKGRRTLNFVLEKLFIS